VKATTNVKWSGRYIPAQQQQQWGRSALHTSSLLQAGLGAVEENDIEEELLHKAEEENKNIEYNPVKGKAFLEKDWTAHYNDMRALLNTGEKRRLRARAIEILVELISTKEEYVKSMPILKEAHARMAEITPRAATRLVYKGKSYHKL
tara:strand:+ start:531 stop:974 length:444 start_codon:yes stop_codon:yes gene_type:complete